MRFAVLASGSRSNAIIINQSDTYLLIDCGLSQQKLISKLKNLGLDLNNLSGILISHEHADHWGCVEAILQNFKIPIFLTYGSAAIKNLKIDDKLTNEIRPQQNFSIDDLDILPVTVPHDAKQPVQFVISSRNRRMGILTDIGHITTAIKEMYSSLDGLIIEFNHDEEMLNKGKYPLKIKKRIAGRYGHLSNSQSIEFLKVIDLSKLKLLVVGHISENNNSLRKINELLKFDEGEFRTIIAPTDWESDWLQL